MHSARMSVSSFVSTRRGPLHVSALMPLEALSSWPLLCGHPVLSKELPFAVAKASQRSSCASSEYGGYFSNPCDGAAASGAAGRRLFMQAPVVV